MNADRLFLFPYTLETVPRESNMSLLETALICAQKLKGVHGSNDIIKATVRLLFNYYLKHLSFLHIQVSFWMYISAILLRYIAALSRIKC